MHRRYAQNNTLINCEIQTETQVVLGERENTTKTMFPTWIKDDDSLYKMFTTTEFWTQLKPGQGKGRILCHYAPHFFYEAFMENEWIVKTAYPLWDMQFVKEAELEKVVHTIGKNEYTGSKLVGIAKEIIEDYAPLSKLAINMGKNKPYNPLRHIVPLNDNTNLLVIDFAPKWSSEKLISYENGTCFAFPEKLLSETPSLNQIINDCLAE